LACLPARSHPKTQPATLRAIRHHESRYEHDSRCVWVCAHGAVIFASLIAFGGVACSVPSFRSAILLRKSSIVSIRLLSPPLSGGTRRLFLSLCFSFGISHALVSVVSVIVESRSDRTYCRSSALFFYRSTSLFFHRSSLMSCAVLCVVLGGISRGPHNPMSFLFPGYLRSLGHGSCFG
jgi:hypothetical protein